ncbi:MAG: dipeptidase [Gemmatimonadales bacterium]|jgi:acetylornithine deacetylase/succinyl-diaminopimelate desuccinylase-like protein
MPNYQSFVADNRERMLGELTELLAIPSVSTDPEYARECRRAADWVAEHMRALGCPKVELLASETHPVILAESPKIPGKPTILVYGHYDVQPPEPLELWDSPPYEATIRDGNIYARGATDDKGQFFAIVKAYEAITRDGPPPVNIRFLIEGQEESGSDILFDLLEKHPELVRADAALVADTQYYAPGWPAIEVGLRGICYGEITVRTLEGDLHSGLYGGVAPNAHETLVNILAKLKSEKGRIRIPGLYEAIKRPTKRERDAWEELPFSQRKFMREEVGAKALTGLSRYSVFERLWALPTLEIHGITGGYTAAGAKTVIPAEATAKVSLRLVPNQKAKTVERQLTRAVKQAAPKYADVSVSFIHSGDPVLCDIDHPAFAVIDQAFTEVEGRGVVLTRSGGSIPIVPALAKEGAAVLLAGLGLPDDRLHAPNEKLGVDQFLNGVQVFGRFFELMGQ